VPSKTYVANSAVKGENSYFLACRYLLTSDIVGDLSIPCSF